MDGACPATSLGCFSYLTRVYMEASSAACVKGAVAPPRNASDEMTTKTSKGCCGLLFGDVACVFRVLGLKSARIQQNPHSFARRYPSFSKYTQTSQAHSFLAIASDMILY